ncbi:hypothetical protein San01_17460 [Streptomyces angustmyceticus]|uniref:Uncharacterized protein n=1 Tax=Streptomyces angustmyceticus TaxID=285578 RepID=A0A5J4LCE2_9ACTN|nr:hypothetical protein San01_17460 [Streptomyces angustmyceticus]
MPQVDHRKEDTGQEKVPPANEMKSETKGSEPRAAQTDEKGVRTDRLRESLIGRPEPGMPRRTLTWTAKPGPSLY